MVAFVRQQVPDHRDHGQDVVQGGDVDADPLQDLPQVFQLVLGVLDGGAPHDTVHLVPLLQEEFGEIGAVLAGYACYQSFLHRAPVSFCATRRLLSPLSRQPVRPAAACSTLPSFQRASWAAK